MKRVFKEIQRPDVLLDLGYEKLETPSYLGIYNITYRRQEQAHDYPYILAVDINYTMYLSDNPYGTLIENTSYTYEQTQLVVLNSEQQEEIVRVTIGTSSPEEVESLLQLLTCGKPATP